MIEYTFGAKPCFRYFLKRQTKSGEEQKPIRPGCWFQTSKSLQTGQNYIYISQYNLKQKKIITIKYVLSEFKERRDFPWCGD